MVLECAKCKKAFESLSWLKRHEQRKTPCAPYVEPPADSKYVCNHCGRDYASQKTLLVHVRLHCKIAARQDAGTTGPAAVLDELKCLAGSIHVPATPAPDPTDCKELMAVLVAQNAKIASMITTFLALREHLANGAANPAKGSPAAATPSPGAIAANTTVGSPIAPTPAPGALAVNASGGARRNITNTTQAAGEVGLIQCDYSDIAMDKSVTFNRFGNESLAHTGDRVKGILAESLRSTLPSWRRWPSPRRQC